MPQDSTGLLAFLNSVHPYDSLPQDELARVATSFSRRNFDAGQTIFDMGAPLSGIYLIVERCV